MASAFIDHVLCSLQISRKLLLHYCLQPTLDYIFDGRVHADSNPRYRIDGVVSEIERHSSRLRHPEGSGGGGAPKTSASEDGSSCKIARLQPSVLIRT
jgi:hypothetical protein